MSIGSDPLEDALPSAAKLDPHRATVHIRSDGNGDDDSSISHATKQDTPSILNDRFELLKALGESGMGMAYKARDRRKVEAGDSNECVAIKLLSDSFRRHPVSFATLPQEATKTQELFSENIVRVFVFDRDGDTIYMTMDLLVGNTLAELLAVQRENDTTLNRQTIWRITGEICAALMAAHASGILHSGLKPDPRDDIYGLGCIVCEMLAGSHRYSLASALQAQQLDVKPKQISGLDINQWQALSSALNFERDTRIGSAEVFAQRLVPKPTISKPSRYGLASALAAALVLFLGNFYLVWDSERQKHQALQSNTLQERKAFYEKSLAKAGDCLVQENPECARGHLQLVRSSLLDEPRIPVYEQPIIDLERAPSLKQEQSLTNQRDSAEQRALAAEQQVREDMARAAKLKLQAQVGGHLEKTDACIEQEALQCARKPIDVAATLAPKNALLKNFTSRFNDLRKRWAERAEVPSQEEGQAAQVMVAA